VICDNCIEIINTLTASVRLHCCCTRDKKVISLCVSNGSVLLHITNNALCDFLTSYTSTVLKWMLQKLLKLLSVLTIETVFSSTVFVLLKNLHWFLDVCLNRAV